MGQDRAIETALSLCDTTKRTVTGLVLPTGAGKSLSAMAIATIGGYRTAVLTANKGLQDIYAHDGESLNIRDIRGASNYPCVAADVGVNCDHGPCHAGQRCDLKWTVCGYFRALEKARQSRSLIVTNYDLWITQHRWGKGLGEFDCLILDEAHLAPAVLASQLSTHISHADLHWLGGRTLPKCDSHHQWREWAKAIAKQYEPRFTQATEDDEGAEQLTRDEIRYRLRLKRVAQKFKMLGEIGDDWVLTQDAEGLTADPIIVAPYAEQYLFLDIPRIILMSATLTQKTVALLGLNQETTVLHEQDSTFPVARRPVYFVPTCRVDSKWDEDDIRMWVRRIDQIIRARQDRNGIIHCVSYDRAALILKYSEFSGTMLAPRGGRETSKAVEQLGAGIRPTVLVSPALSTGWDFPGRACEYQILAKVPFPDTRSPVVAARCHLDPDYRMYYALQQLVQACGRGMRSESDQCESFIIDDHWKYMWKYRRFAPSWFWAAVRTADTLPSPPARLAA